ncbi:hypothetical protein, partial [Pseudomonas sp. EA_65y_Pfl1_P113]|uniref:hypothetical protein n=1 Tax=Pseudomonas sp. EA_65y_Pfl1_P113 TaxID=3088692 RepID=UPI0030D7A46A
PAKPHGWWGYSTNDGEWFHGPFGSREAALDAAQGDYPDEACMTAWCIPNKLNRPDLRDHCIDALADLDDIGVSGVSWAFSGVNEDVDYDGEMSEALENADYSVIVADLRDATANALFRAGRPDLIAALYRVPHRRGEPLCEDETLFGVLSRDAAFGRDCDEAAERFIAANDLDSAPRTLWTEHEASHDALEGGVAA